MPSSGSSIKGYAVFSDSTLLTENKCSFQGALIERLRESEGSDVCSLYYKVKGGYTLREMARDLAEAFCANAAPFEYLV